MAKTHKTKIIEYFYNGHELQEEYNLNYLNYGWRQLDPQLGRWHCVDKLASVYAGESAYSYAGNNPVNQIDIAGLIRTYNYASNEWEGSRGWDGDDFRAAAGQGSLNQS